MFFSDFPVRQRKSSSRARLSSPAQLPARRLFDLSDQALREALDLGVGQSTVLRLKHDGDRERFLALRQPRALVNIEEADLGDKLAVDAAGGAQQNLGRQLAIDDEGKVTLDRLEHR